MADHACQKMVGRLRQAQSPFVALVEEQVFPRLGIGQMKMDVQPASRLVGKRLGHVGGDRPVFAGDLPRGHLEKRDAVGRRERVGVIEIHLELRIAVFVIDLIDAPAQAVERSRQLLQKVHRRSHRAEVVARLRQPVDAQRIPATNAAILGPRDEKNSGSIPTLNTNPCDRASASTRERFVRQQ